VREFEDRPAVRGQVPLLLGIVGCSGSGKTFSALRLATGMQQVIGGDIFVIDTEHDRALHYAELFRFRHIALGAPFGSEDYLAAIEYAYRRGGRIIVVDSMTHEHSGEGGYIYLSEEYLSQKPEKERGKYNRSSWIIPAAKRKVLNSGIVQLGINGIFCYRAQEKLDDSFKPLGWQPETTSRLIYEMQQQFLLEPGSNGIPKFDNATEQEKKLIKTPAMFRDWFPQGQRLDETMGERMARWSAGSEPEQQAEPSATTSTETQPEKPKRGRPALTLEQIAADIPKFTQAAKTWKGRLLDMDDPEDANRRYYGVLGSIGVEHAGEIGSAASRLLALQGWSEAKSSGPVQTAAAPQAGPAPGSQAPASNLPPASPEALPAPQVVAGPPGDGDVTANEILDLKVWVKDHTKLSMAEVERYVSSHATKPLTRVTIREFLLFMQKFPQSDLRRTILEGQLPEGTLRL